MEWAPDNSFTSSEKVDTGSEKSKKGGKSQNETDEVKEENESKVEKKEEKDDEDDEEPEPDTTLFVKNLNFSTMDEDLKKVIINLCFIFIFEYILNLTRKYCTQHFGRCGPLHYATVAMKKDPNNPSAKLSMGYGFVRYKYKVHTDRALKELQMTNLDGKTLELKRSERTLQ